MLQMLFHAVRSFARVHDTPEAGTRLVLLSITILTKYRHVDIAIHERLQAFFQGRTNS